MTTKAKRHVRKLGRTGTYTYFLTLPKSEIDALGWRHRQKLVVRRSGSRLIVEDWTR